MNPYRNVKYLQKLSHFPLAILIDAGGEEWTWAEGRSLGIALRGRLEGLPRSTVEWADRRRWRPAMKAAFADPRQRASRVYTRERLLQWTGQPWIAPDDPCPHCYGTGDRHGSRLGRMRPGSLRRGVYLDMNLLASLLLPFATGALTIDALKNRDTDPIRLKAGDIETRAVLARMRNEPPQMPTFEDTEHEMEGSLTLSGPSTTLEPVGRYSGASEPSKPVQGLSEPAPFEGPRPSVRRKPIESRHDTKCVSCGGSAGGGVCESCGKMVNL